MALLVMVGPQWPFNLVAIGRVVELWCLIRQVVTDARATTQTVLNRRPIVHFAVELGKIRGHESVAGRIFAAAVGDPQILIGEAEVIERGRYPGMQSIQQRYHRGLGRQAEAGDASEMGQLALHRLFFFRLSARQAEE